MGGTGILTIAANDTVGLQLKNEGSGDDFVVEHLNLTLVRVGD
jgi:hypothetical protein